MKVYFTFPIEGEFSALMWPDEQAAMEASGNDADTHMTVELSTVDERNLLVELCAFFQSGWRCAIIVPGTLEVQSAHRALLMARHAFPRFVEAYK